MQVQAPYPILKLKRFIIFLLLSMPSNQNFVRADDTPEEYRFIDEGKMLQSLARHSVFLEWSKSHPTIHSGRHLTPHAITPKFGYRHYYDPHWMVGVGGQFKSLRTLSDAKQLSYWTIFHEAYGLIRIYHPVYFCAGMKAFYLVPTKASKLPLERRNDFQTDIGVGASIGVIARIGPKFNLQIFGDRWRGTKNNELHAYEVAGGISYNL